MSQENVEVVRRYLEGMYANAYRDYADTRELVDRFFDPDADFYPVRKFTEARPCHGRDEVARLSPAF